MSVDRNGIDADLSSRMAAQVLPISSSHFAQYPSTYDPGMFASLPSKIVFHFNRSMLTFQAYAGLHGEAYHTYHPDHHNSSMYLLSQDAHLAGEPIQRPPPLSPSAQMRLPPRRDRTPIRHHRPSVSRPRSHSRSEMIMAYATEQAQIPQAPPAQPSMTVVPSQSAPTTPQIFPGQHPSAYPASSAAESYADASGYFPTAISPPTSLPDFNYQPDAHFEGYYQLGRSASQSAASNLSLNPQDTMYYQAQGPAPQSLPPIGAAIASFPPIQAPLESSRGDLEILTSRPKPQCWDHGCNGRQFSTFSNLLRHQREKSGSAMKAICPYCGTEFTRTTARNGHMYGGKCKGVPEKAPSEASTAGSTSGKERP